MNTGKVLAAAALIGAIGITGAIYQYNRSEGYRQSLENNYQRAFVELVDYIGNIDVILNKALVTNDYLQLADLSKQLWSETALAKSALGQLPLSSENLDKTSSFITQVSDYVHSLTKKLLSGETITREEHEQIAVLVEYSDSLNGDLKEMENDFINGSLSLSEQQARSVFDEENTDNLTGRIGAIEKSFENYPTIIYDGPFAEHVLNRRSEILNQKEVTQAYALEAAQKFTGTELEYSGDTNGNIPSFIFSSDGGNICIEISKNGGRVVMMTNSTDVKNPQIEIEEASEIASEFLVNNGYENMKQTGYVLEGNVVNFAFAYVFEEYTVYSDLIKIKISLHDGSIYGFESNGFLFNHKERITPTVIVSREDALANINQGLEIEKVNMACIPRDNGTECWCYEIRGRLNNKTFLVYVNVTTGHEEEILLFVEDANGSLTV